jgi:hypothetical protein
MPIIQKQGLASILAGGILDGKSEDEKEDILLQAKVFYFNRHVKHAIVPLRR